MSLTSEIPNPAASPQPPAGRAGVGAGRPDAAAPAAAGDGGAALTADGGTALTEALLVAARAGDREALTRLVESFRPYLRAVTARALAGRLSGKADPSDVVQQCLMSAVAKFPQFRGNGAAEWHGWLTAILNNAVRRMLRHWRRDIRDIDRERPLPAEGAGGGPGPGGGPGAAPDPAVEPLPPADQSSPSVVVSRREQAARLMAALESLPEDYRTVLRLRHLEDLPFAEVAARMGRSEQALRQLWVRAVRKLRERLGWDASSGGVA